MSRQPEYLPINEFDHRVYTATRGGVCACGFCDSSYDAGAELLRNSNGDFVIREHCTVPEANVQGPVFKDRS
jgi:hypothetical protein